MISRILTLIFLGLVVFLLSGCASSDNDQLEEEVLALHDEVMPWLDDMKAKRRQLSRLQQADKNRISAAKHQLYLADSLMWAWMYQYKPVENIEDSLTTVELTDYLMKQREYIQRVNFVTKNAMAEADELLSGSLRSFEKTEETREPKEIKSFE